MQAALPLQKTIAAIELTSRCNAKCDFCVSWYDKVEKSLGEVRHIIDDLPKSIATVVFVGGEPLIWKDLFAALRYAKDKGYKTKLHTNGLLLPSVSDGQLDLIDTINLPVDAVSDEYALRKNQPIEKIQKNIARLMGLGKEISITTVVTRENLHLLRSVQTFLSLYPVKSWKIFKFAPEGLGKDNKGDLFITDKEFDAATSKLELPSGKVYKIKDFFDFKSSVFY